MSGQQGNQNLFVKVNDIAAAIRQLSQKLSSAVQRAYPWQVLRWHGVIIGWSVLTKIGIRSTDTRTQEAGSQRGEPFHRLLKSSAEGYTGLVLQ